VENEASPDPPLPHDAGKVIPPGLAGQPTSELVIAKINGRFIAYVIDTLLFALGYSATLIIGQKIAGGTLNQSLALRIGAIWLGLYVFYQFVSNMMGATLGKKLVGLQVLQGNGEPLGAAGSFLRAIFYLIGTPFLNFGFLIALFTPRSRALHDLVSGSVVVERESQNPAEAGALFLGAISLFILLIGAVLFLSSIKPSASSVAAQDKARQALEVMAQIEENYKSSHGVYTGSLSDLAAASGDIEKFKFALLNIFDPNSFRLEGGNNAYRISAVAKDRERTRFTVAGPPPSVKP
jgi:uncharacterized RDD family membrane protein YckC